MLKNESEKVGRIFQEMKQEIIEVVTYLGKEDQNNQWRQFFKVVRILKNENEKMGRKFTGIIEGEGLAA